MLRVEITDYLRVVDATSKAVRKAAEEAVLLAGARALSQLQVDFDLYRPLPVDRGTFRSGWRLEPVDRGVALFNVAPHAPFPEYGVRAENVKIGRKMIDALAEWVLRKGLLAKPRSGTGPKRATGKGSKAAKAATREAEARKVAWAIARAMKTRGIFAEGKGFGMLAAVVKRLPEYVAEEFKDAVERNFGAGR